MEKLSFPEFVRFLLIGYIIFVLYFICYRPISIDELLKINFLPISILAFIVGFLAFFLYRVLFYNTFILRLWICLSKKNKWPNVVTEIQKCYANQNKTKIKNVEAETLWKIIKSDPCLESDLCLESDPCIKDMNNLDLGSAATQLFYMISISSLLFAVSMPVTSIITFFVCDFTSINWSFSFEFMYMVIIAIVSIFIGVINHRYIDRQTLYKFKSLNKKEMDRLVVDKIGFMKRKN